MPPKRKLDYEEVRRLRQEGMTLQALAAQFGVSCSSIDRIVNLEPAAVANPQGHPSKLAEGALEKIQKLRAAGLTFDAIGERLGVSRNTLSRTLRKAGRAPKES